MANYSDFPLDASKKQIRLLNLQPASNISEEIFGTLVVASLDNDHTSFEVLSYTWGTAKEAHALRLNGTSVQNVTDNLFYALRRLRRSRKERAIWVDAVCIDQSNIGEKSQQVAMMSEIYSRASLTLIWIGESERSEIAEHDATKQIVSTADDAVSQIRDIRNRHRKKKSSEQIGALAWDTRLAEASVAHDKAYSLLAMMPQNEADLLQPNYREPIGETFAKLTFAIMHADKRLDILGCIPFRNLREDSDDANHERDSTEVDEGRASRLFQNPEPSSWTVNFKNLK